MPDQKPEFSDSSCWLTDDSFRVISSHFLLTYISKKWWVPWCSFLWRWQVSQSHKILLLYVNLHPNPPPDPNFTKSPGIFPCSLKPFHDYWRGLPCFLHRHLYYGSNKPFVHSWSCLVSLVGDLYTEGSRYHAPLLHWGAWELENLRVRLLGWLIGKHFLLQFKNRDFMFFWRKALPNSSMFVILMGKLTVKPLWSLLNTIANGNS